MLVEDRHSSTLLTAVAMVGIVAVLLIYRVSVAILKAIVYTCERIQDVENQNARQGRKDHESLDRS